MQRLIALSVSTALAVLLGMGLLAVAPPSQPDASAEQTVRDFGAAGDGKADDTSAIQKAVDAGIGLVRFPPGKYRLTRTIEIDLDTVGYTAIAGDSAAQLIMAGPGPALRFVGTHAGTAAPRTFKKNVWERQRTPAIDGLEIVGAHAEACGVEASGTMQLTITRLAVREALDAVRLVKRNRNVVLSECHFYHNRGIGVLLDHVNLHQINLTNCHVSYNAGGGVVVRGSELRNLHIGTCDIEANMGDADSAPTANVWLDSGGGSIAEVAITGCTLQHSHLAPKSANIRIDGQSLPLKYTDERRYGHITIADNVLSEAQVNIELRNVRAATISGNTMWQGYSRNIDIAGSKNIVLTGNLFDRNPRYHGGDAATARLGIEIVDSSDCTLTGNHVYDVGDIEAAIVLRRCRRMNIDGCTILDYGRCGLLLDDVRDSRVSDCMIRDDRPEGQHEAIRTTGGGDNQIVDNVLVPKPGDE